MLKCIDDKGRPADIPLSKWIKAGEYYTEHNRFLGLGGVEIVQIEEIDLIPLGTSYKGFDAKRFKQEILEIDSIKNLNYSLYE